MTEQAEPWRLPWPVTSGLAAVITAALGWGILVGYATRDMSALTHNYVEYLTANRVLIGADLDRFLDRAPQYTPLRDRLALFFAGSDAAFFGLGESAPQDLPALARDLAAIERGRR